MGMQQEIYLILIGAAIGFLSSIGTTIVADWLNSHGKVKLYYKIVYSKLSKGRTWGFYKSSYDLFFEVPIWIELHNTSNRVRVIRDFNILLFCNGKEINQMTQNTSIKIKESQNDDWQYIDYGNKGSYSFVLQPRSIEKYDCHFIIKQNQLGDNSQFDEIKLHFFNEKDKCIKYPLKKIDHCWEVGEFKKEDIWKLATK